MSRAARSKSRSLTPQSPVPSVRGWFGAWRCPGRANEFRWEEVPEVAVCTVGRRESRMNTLVFSSLFSVPFGRRCVHPVPWGMSRVSSCSRQRFQATATISWLIMWRIQQTQNFKRKRVVPNGLAKASSADMARSCSVLEVALMSPRLKGHGISFEAKSRTPWLPSSRA